MFQSALAFIVWGCPGPFLVGFHLDPLLLALCRYFFSGIFFVALWSGVLFFRNKISLPWKDRNLWISGIVILARNIFYMLAFASGPAAVAGLIYGYAPLLIPVGSYLLGLEQKRKVSTLYLCSLAVSFVGNYLIFRGLQHETIAFGGTVLLALAAAFCYILTPLFSFRLQQQGLEPKALVGAQSIVAALVAVPLLFLFIIVGKVNFSDIPQIQRTVGFAGLIAIFFTILPFYLWYSGIKKSGINRVAPMGFLEPLTSSLISFYILGDAKANATTTCGLIALFVGFILAVADSRIKNIAAVVSSSERS